MFRSSSQKQTIEAFKPHLTGRTDDLERQRFLKQREMVDNFLAPLIRSDSEKMRRALDVGCAWGGVVQRLRELDFEAVGIEPEWETCNWRAADWFVAAVGENLPFPDQTFDLVTAFEVIEHVGRGGIHYRRVRKLEEARQVRKRRLTFATELLRVTTQGGTVVLTTPNKLFPFDTHQAKFQGGVGVFGLRLHSPWETFLLSYKEITSLLDGAAQALNRRVTVHTLSHEGYIRPQHLNELLRSHLAKGGKVPISLIPALFAVLRRYVAFIDAFPRFHITCLNPELLVLVEAR